MILIDKLLYYLITKKSTKQTFIHSFYIKVKFKKNKNTRNFLMEKQLTLIKLY